MKSLHFGWVFPNEGPQSDPASPAFRDLEERILPAAAKHFDSLWVYDHLYAFSSPRAPYLEAWTALTWLAARVPALQLGTLVLSVHYRSPALLGKMAATLHALSGGRLILGLGAGWRAEEYHAYGYRFPPPAERVRQLEEATILIRRMWTEPAPSFQGEHYSIQDAYVSPRLDSPPLLWIGGEGERRMLPMIARLADGWNCGVLPGLDDYRRKRDILREAAERAGRDPDSLVYSLHSMFRPWPESAADARGWVDFLGGLVQLGFTHFMIDAGPAAAPEVFERFAGEVLEPVRALGF